MRHDKYRYNNTEEVVYYLKKYQRVKEEWQADFYDAYGRHMLTFESSDEETMDALNDEDKLYSLVAEWLDFALMIIPKTKALGKSKLRACKTALCEAQGSFVLRLNALRYIKAESHYGIPSARTESNHRATHYPRGR